MPRDKKYIDVRFVFEEVPDEIDERIVYPELVKIFRIGSNMPQTHLNLVAEDWTQSDRYSIDIVAALIGVACDGDEFKP